MKQWVWFCSRLNLDDDSDEFGQSDETVWAEKWMADAHAKAQAAKETEPKDAQYSVYRVRINRIKKP